MLYFAYGSNLNIEQMQLRCPAAMSLGKLMLPNYRLLFRGVCDIVPEKGIVCPGGLWRITPECEKALDRYEGFDARYPDRGMYFKEYVQVKGIDAPIMVYRMNSSGIMPPSIGYFGAVKQGYKDFGLKLKPLLAALQHSHDENHPTHVERKRRRRNGRQPFAQPRKPKEDKPEQLSLIERAPIAQKYDRVVERKAKNLTDWLEERRTRNRYRPVNE